MTKHRISWNTPSADTFCELSAGSELFVQLAELFRIERCYLNPDLSVELICGRLSINRRTLLRAVKNHGFGSFPHFVNHHRIEEAKKMMSQAAFDIYTLEAIAEKSGFGTRQAFYNTFERLVGMKPAHYRRMLKRQRSVPV